MTHYTTIDELDENLKVSGMGRTSVCIIQESLYNENIYSSISDRAKTILVTFGPEGGVDRRKKRHVSFIQFVVAPSRPFGRNLAIVRFFSQDFSRRDYCRLRIRAARWNTNALL